MTDYEAVILRNMKEADLDMVAGLEQVCFSDPWSPGLLKDGLDSRWDTLFVAEDRGRICGYAALRILADEGEIQRIAVFPEYRRLGIGRKLMESMVSFARAQGAEAMTLEVRAGNMAAIRLYESYGFVEEGRRKRYYHNPEEDAVIMWRRKP